MRTVAGDDVTTKYDGVRTYKGRHHDSYEGFKRRIRESSRLKEITSIIDETNFVDEDIFKQAKVEPNPQNLYDP
nr:hypothetical protein [Tanacetum cinerariifolium]